MLRAVFGFLLTVMSAFPKGFGLYVPSCEGSHFQIEAKRRGLRFHLISRDINFHEEGKLYGFRSPKPSPVGEGGIETAQRFL